MSDVTVDRLMLQVDSEAQQAYKGLDALDATLKKLQSTVGKLGLNGLAENMSSVANATKKLSGESVSNIDRFASVWQRLSQLGKPQLSKTTANQLTAIGSAVRSLDGINFNAIRELTAGIAPLQDVGKATNLNSNLNALKKIPEITETLDSKKLTEFSQKIKQVTAAVKPLSTEMEKVSAGFSKLPANMQRAINANAKLTVSNTRTTKSYSFLGTGISSVKAKLGIYAMAASKLYDVAGGWVVKSNEYVENLNLFTVSMGKYAQEALDYAEKVQDKMGIDMSEWIRNQGVFMQIASGFGVVEDKAYTMSKGLTQVAYDISSFFNIDIAQSLEKVQSGIAGELEPLRRLGYALDVATLQQIAYQHGIEQNINKMTQAQKSQLRYIAIMEQSNNVLGDMARTLITPANAMRILNQQTVQLQRALGNLFIPVLIKIIPYVQAFIKLLTEFIQVGANFLGFEIPTIDYSNMDGLKSGAEGANDALNDVNDTAEKVKKNIMGFDQLNILSEPKSKDSKVDVPSYDLGVDLSAYDYDFLGELDNQTEKIYKKMKVWFSDLYNTLKEYEPLLKTLGGLMVALWAFGKVKKFVSYIQSLWKWFSNLSIVKTVSGAFKAFFSAFSKYRRDGNGLFASFKGGMKAFRDSLSTTQKVAGSLIALGIEFVTVKEAVKNLALGNISLNEALYTIIPACAAVGVAMYAMLGPWGLVAAAVVGIGAAIYGACEAYDEMVSQFVQTTVFDGVGISLSVFNDKLKASTQSIIDNNTQIINWGSKIAEANQKINESVTKIQGLTLTLGESGTVTYDEIEEIKGYFSTLYDTIKEKMSYSQEVINTALVQAMKDATPEISTQIDTLIGEYQRFVRETQGRAAELKNQIEGGYDELIGKATNSEDYNKIMSNINNWYKELGSLQGGMSEASFKWEDTLSKFNNGEIDFGDDVGDAKKQIGEIASTGKEALDSIKEARTTTMTELENAIAYASEYKQEYLPALYDTRDSLEKYYSQQESEVKKEIESVFSGISTGLAGSAKKVLEEASKKYDSKEGWDKFWSDFVSPGGNGKAKFQEDTISKFKTDIFDPISTELNNQTKSLGASAKNTGTAVVGGLLDGLKTVKNGSYGENNGYFLTGVDALKGYINGARSKLGDAKKTGEDIFKFSYDGLYDEGDFGSPSKRTFKAGVWSAQGLGNGVKSETPYAVKSFVDMTEKSLSVVKKNADLSKYGKQMSSTLADGIDSNTIVFGFTDTFNQVLQKLQQFSDNFTGSLNRVVSGFADSVSNVKVEANGSVSYQTIPKVTVPKVYAEGGFPNRGEMFIAREAGPELVGSMGNRSAVANNQQIVDGISRGVYRAVKEAQGDGAMNVTVVNQIDGDEVARRVYKIKKEDSRRYNRVNM